MFHELLTMPYKALRVCVSPTVISTGSVDDSIPGLARELVQPSVTFHGTFRLVVESIVRYGFIVPGNEIGKTGHKIDALRGCTYGSGVYSSPDP